MMISRDNRHPSFIARGVFAIVFLGAFCINFPSHLEQMHLLRAAQAQGQSTVTGELTVFAAASLTDAFTEIGKRLELSHPGLKVVYNFGGSQALRTQLEQGARADVFASADVVQMEQAKKSNTVQGESPAFVKNKLVAIVPKDNKAKVTSFCDLGKPGVKLDLANSKVPVGNYSRQVIAKANSECGADFEQRTLKNLVSEEENVKQVVTKIQLGEADAGIVYVSDVTPKVSRDVQAIAIAEAHNQLATYPIALTKEVRNRAAAQAFIDFVLSAEGQAILKAHSFIPLKE